MADGGGWWPDKYLTSSKLPLYKASHQAYLGTVRRPTYAMSCGLRRYIANRRQYVVSGHRPARKK